MSDIDLYNDASAAADAIDAYLNNRPMDVKLREATIIYISWRRKRIAQYIDQFDSFKPIFEDTGTLDRYYAFRTIYIEDLNECYTRLGFHLLFLFKEAVLHNPLKKVINNR